MVQYCGLVRSYLQFIVNRLEQEPARATHYPNILIEFGAEIAITEPFNSLIDDWDAFERSHINVQFNEIEPLVDVFISDLPQSMRYLIWSDLPDSKDNIQALCNSGFENVDDLIREDIIRDDISSYIVGELRELSTGKLAEYLNHVKMPGEMTHARQLANDISLTLEQLSNNYFDKPHSYYVGDEIKRLNLSQGQLSKLKPIIRIVAEEAAHATLSGLAGETKLGTQNQQYHLIDTTGRKVSHLPSLLVEVFEEREKSLV
ncbi:hypothetical protein NF212_06975 [Parasalinivibrio latis]